MGKNLTLGELTAKPGEKVSGWLHIADSGLEIPVSLICGMQDGPTVLVTGGIHNAEASGILLIQTVSLNVLKGGSVLSYCELKEQENSF